ncbi:MAG: hypothetical protein H6741_24200 [Alphaproteobacteria bacterium]|nr:hypothetical protein [Alphaproteobacteria bacterium]
MWTEAARGRPLVVVDGALGDVVLRLPTLAAVAARHGPLEVLAPGRWCRLLEQRGFAGRARRLDAAEWLPLWGARPEHAAGGLEGIGRALILHEDPALARGLEALGIPTTQAPNDPPHGVHQALHAWEHAVGFHGRPTPGGPEALPLPLVDPRPAPRELDVLVVPGSGGPRKCWPRERFAALGGRLARSGRSVRVLLGPQELERGWSRADWGGLEILEILDLCHTLGQMARTRLVVGNDAGTSHLAAAAGAAVLALFGPTSSQRWRPMGPEVAVLAAPALDELDVETVHEAVEAHCSQIHWVEQPRG